MLKQALISAVEAGAKEILYYYNKSFFIKQKGSVTDLVTEADHASEKAIFAVIKEHFPTHHILSEESGELVQDSTYKWIIDPIDGTFNFAHHIPINAVSIAIEHNNEIVMAAIYNPHLQELFFAEKNKGATLNDEPIHVSEKTEIKQVVLSTGFSSTNLQMENGPLAVHQRFVENKIKLRVMGSAAVDLCWIAAGRFDGTYSYKLETWDTAAGSLMVEEAGGVVSDLNGNKFSPYQKTILATNKNIHAEILALINNQICLV